MLAWSDLPRASGWPTAVRCAALAARVVPAGARVLLAGPHDPALLDRLGRRRGDLPAAQPPGRAWRWRRGPPAWWCGGPAGLPDDEPYDVVIAGAGLDPVESVEGARLGWGGALARLVAALRPGGTLLLRAGQPARAAPAGGRRPLVRRAGRLRLGDRRGAATAVTRPTGPSCASGSPRPGCGRPPAGPHTQSAGAATALLDADQLDRDAGCRAVRRGAARRLRRRLHRRPGAPGPGPAGGGRAARRARRRPRAAAG